MAPTSIATTQDTSVNFNSEWAKQLSSSKQITLVGVYWEMTYRLTFPCALYSILSLELCEAHNEYVKTGHDLSPLLDCEDVIAISRSLLLILFPNELTAH